MWSSLALEITLEKKFLSHGKRNRSAAPIFIYLFLFSLIWNNILFCTIHFQSIFFSLSVWLLSLNYHIAFIITEKWRKRDDGTAENATMNWLCFMSHWINDNIHTHWQEQHLTQTVCLDYYSQKKEKKKLIFMSRVSHTSNWYCLHCCCFFSFRSHFRHNKIRWSRERTRYSRMHTIIVEKKRNCRQIKENSVICVKPDQLNQHVAYARVNIDLNTKTKQKNCKSNYRAPIRDWFWGWNSLVEWRWNANE